ncbi:MAG TPA: hypothetical protein QF624_01305 [Dehalococcoidia bacterium]|nr:hypothetical protein [Dehalococcoidia bacterium]
MICAPLFGRNGGISREFLDPSAPPRRAFVPARWYADPLDHLRFDLRRPLPEVREALSRLSTLRRLTILTGRRSSPESWLRRYGMAAFIDDIEFNASEERSAHFKLRRSAELGAAEHIDDDPRTVQLLAEAGALRVFLRDWPRNRGLPFVDGVTRVSELTALANLLEAEREGNLD